MASKHIPGGAAAARPAAPVLQEFHTLNVQSYGERPDPAMRTVHVSYSYATEEPHITLEFADSEATWGKKKASVHLRAIKDEVPWKFSSDDLQTAMEHVGPGRMSILKLKRMVAELYNIKQQDAAKQCASAIASAQPPAAEEVAERKEQAKKVQNGGIFG
ncbi:MAG TPA: hypothetical protein VIM59_01765 [Cellvibrio sp.]